MPRQNNLMGGFSEYLGRRLPYEGTPSFRMYLAPFAGGWTSHAIIGAVHQPQLDFVTFASGVIISDSATGCNLTRPLHLPYPIDDNPGSGLYTLSRLNIRYFRNAAADAVSLDLMRVPVNAGALPASIATWDETALLNATGALTSYTDTATNMPIVLDTSVYYYFLWLILSPNAAANGVAVGNLDIDIDKAVVE